MRNKILRWQIRINTALKFPEKHDMDCEYRDFLQKLSFLQHERLIHLIVTMGILVTVAILGAIAVHFPLIWPVLGILFVLETFYLLHYYFLENTTQAWYDRYEEFEEKVNARRSARIRSIENRTEERL